MDLHGHSRKQNVFTYGCRSNQGDHNQFLNERIFPFLMSRQVYLLLSDTILYCVLYYITCYSFQTSSASVVVSTLCSVVKNQQVEWWLGGWDSTMRSHWNPPSVGAHWGNPQGWKV